MSDCTYGLSVKVGDQWNLVCEITAASHADALRDAIARIEPEHDDKPIRLEMLEDGAQRSLYPDSPMFHIPFA